MTTDTTGTPGSPDALGIGACRDLVRTGRASAVECARAALERAARAQRDLNAFVELCPDEAMAQARAVDEGRVRGPLAGVPIALKDNLCTAWGRTTCGSRLLETYRSPFTAAAVQRLLDAGAVVIGKTNLDEFSMGSSTEHSAFGPTRNPWDPRRVPGGSSGGSAAAVAAGVVPGALGSDTGGSIRQPAGFCGVVGMKPTYGRVSRRGLVAYASSLDQVGPIARSVRDAAILLTTIAGHDPGDSTSAPLPHEDFERDLETPPPGLVIGLPRQARSDANHPGVAAAFERAATVLRDAGARLVDVDLATAGHAIAAYYIIATAEASSNLARFDGVRYGRRARPVPGEGLAELYARSRSEGFGHEVQRRILLGTHVLSSGYYDAYYLTALRARRRIKEDFDRAFRAGVHAILLPASPGPAFPLGARSTDPLAMYLEDVYTVGVNLAGLPGVTVPVGFQEDDGARLPVGMQLIGPPLGESTILRGARILERAAAEAGARPACWYAGDAPAQHR